MPSRVSSRLTFVMACLLALGIAATSLFAQARFIDGQLVVPLRERDRSFGPSPFDELDLDDLPTISPLPRRTGASAIPEETLREFQLYLRDNFREFRLPGLAMAIVQDEGIVLEAFFGSRDVREGGTIDAETLFTIGPSTQALTSLLAARAETRRDAFLDLPARNIWSRFRMSTPGRLNPCKSGTCCP